MVVTFKDTLACVGGHELHRVRPINSLLNPAYGASTNNFKNGRVKNKDIICISYNCADSNLLAGIRLATTYNTFNNPSNPTSGNFFTFSTEQFVGVNEDSPTFNRVRGKHPVLPGELAEDPQGMPSQAG